MNAGQRSANRIGGSVAAPAILERRLAAQHIVGTATAPRALVSALAAVQAQDWGAAQWAVALRLGGDRGRNATTARDVEACLADGHLVRTHALRGTWQLVAPDDVHWILELVAPREIARNARRYRELGLDAPTLRRSAAVIEKALRGGRHATRDELRTALDRARITTDGQRLAHVLQRAELDGGIVSGPRRGKQFTYALLDERVPRSGRSRSRDAALAELARRYFQTRGPATIADFAWWSGLGGADARAGLEAVKSELVSEIQGQRRLWRADRAPPRSAGPTTHLLPAFDEYLIAYRDRSDALDPELAARVNAGGGLLAPIVVTGGRVIGIWRRELTRKAVRIDVSLWRAPSRAVRDAIGEAAERYAAFHGLTAEPCIGRV